MGFNTYPSEWFTLLSITVQVDTNLFTVETIAIDIQSRIIPNNRK